MKVAIKEVGYKVSFDDGEKYYEKLTFNDGKCVKSIDISNMAHYDKREFYIQEIFEFIEELQENGLEVYIENRN